MSNHALPVGQERSEQSAPRKPWKQVQIPAELHSPWPEHRFGQPCAPTCDGNHTAAAQQKNRSGLGRINRRRSVRQRTNADGASLAADSGAASTSCPGDGKRMPESVQSAWSVRCACPVRRQRSRDPLTLAQVQSCSCEWGESGAADCSKRAKPNVPHFCAGMCADILLGRRSMSSGGGLGRRALGDGHGPQHAH